MENERTKIFTDIDYVKHVHDTLIFSGWTTRLRNFVSERTEKQQKLIEILLFELIAFSWTIQLLIDTRPRTGVIENLSLIPEHLPKAYRSI